MTRWAYRSPPKRGLKNEPTEGRPDLSRFIDAEELRQTRDIGAWQKRDRRD